MFEKIIQLDKELLIYLNSLGSEQWDSFWLLITNQFYWAPLFILVFYLVIKKYTWKKGIFMILAMIVLVAFSDQFTNLIKNNVARLRPNNDPEVMDSLRASLWEFTNPQSFSFMSGHATTSTFFTVFVILLLKDKLGKKVYWFLLFPLIFSYSRLYLGVHFPIDILVGISIGTLFGNLYFKLYKSLDKNSFV